MTSPIKSFVFYDADGVTRDFTFSFPYLSRDHVKVYVDGVGYGDFAWVGPFSIRTNTTLPTLAGKIKIARETPGDSPLVTIGDGTSLRSVDLNRQSLQAMYVAQEAADAALLVKASALVPPDSDAGRVALEFPSIESRRNNALGFDADGQFRAYSPADMPKGETGDKGDVGAPGPVGPQGTQGLQGPQGPAGDNYSPDGKGLTAGRSAFNAQALGFSYLDIQTGTLYWKLSATSGDWSAGIAFGAGAQGIQGIQGPVGAQGAAGATGAAGTPGMIWRGAYAGPTAYTPKDVVAYNGAAYINILASTGNLPTNATYWNLVASKGDQGIQGVQGPVGPSGPQGSQGIQGIQGVAGTDATITSAAVASAIAGIAYGAVGSSVFAFIFNGGVSDNGTYAGSSLQPAGISSVLSAAEPNDTKDDNPRLNRGGSVLAGTWRALGRVQADTGLNRPRFTLFVRIA
ncbi:phage tail fiber protein [Mesorhizobium sp. M1403]|uniref:phage tail fiber domain-containing protein n=1 Tax=Mesorhizobium sp. M1403 TaxID=2957097 RepID=UPI0033377E27